MKWMILGGGGCFGLHLAKHLLDTNNEVVSVGRGPAPAPWLLRSKPLNYHQLHIVDDMEPLFELMEREQPAVIVNFAALAYSTSWEGSAAYYRTNVGAVASITEWLTGKKWLYRFIQIGSSEVYGSTNYPASEDSALRPTSPYAVSKLAADLHVLALPSLPGVVVRPCNCYGEGQLLYRLIPRAIWSALTGNKLPLEGNGQSRKTWMHVDDLSTGLVMIAERGNTHSVFNIGQVSPSTNYEIMEHVSNATGFPMDRFVEPAPARYGEDQCYRLASSKMYYMGWTPKVSLEQGILRVTHWMERFLPDLGEPIPFVLRP